MDTKTDPVIEDLIKWLKENLPPDAKEEDIFKKVRKIEKVYDTLVGLAIDSLEKPEIDIVGDKLKEIRKYVVLNEEKIIKEDKLNASRSKLDLKKDQYELINSIKLDSCLDLISRYNRLMSKK